MGILQEFKEIKKMSDKLQRMVDGKDYDFKTVREAEEFYMGKFAQTNNMHDEEEYRMEQWLSEQSIEELEGQ